MSCSTSATQRLHHDWLRCNGLPQNVGRARWARSVNASGCGTGVTLEGSAETGVMRPALSGTYPRPEGHPSAVPQKGTRNSGIAPGKSGGLARMMAVARLGIFVLTGRWSRHHVGRRQWRTAGGAAKAARSSRSRPGGWCRRPHSGGSPPTTASKGGAASRIWGSRAGTRRQRSSTRSARPTDTATERVAARRRSERGTAGSAIARTTARRSSMDTGGGVQRSATATAFRAASPCRRNPHHGARRPGSPYSCARR